MKTFGFSFFIDKPAGVITADNVFQARMKIVERFHTEAYAVWEVKPCFQSSSAFSYSH